MENFGFYVTILIAWGIFNMKNNNIFLIHDNRIALALADAGNNDNLNRRFFDIVLFDNNEIIGKIGYDLDMNNEVIFSILSQYQKKHYATDALALLKEYMYNIYQDDNMELYIVALNNASAKVAINNGGILIPSWEEFPDYYFRAKHYKIRVKPE